MADMFIDYYEMFDLDRSMTEKELKKQLGRRSVELSQMEGTTPPDDIVTRKEQQESKKLLLEAIKILGKPASRKRYDAELDEAIRAGRVNHERSREVQNALERARKYFEQQKYRQALNAAQEALENHANSDEPYEIISRSMFMLGDYEESLEVVDKGAELFQNALNLWWLRIRTRILMENYTEAQTVLNQALDRFRGNTRLAAEQAYLYFHADKIELGTRTMEAYMRENPSDMEYRQYMAYNLIEVANYCYRYDTAADMQLIIEQADYDKCLKLVTLANRCYQDDYTKSALHDVQFYGEIRYDEDSRKITKVYMGVSIVTALIGIYLLLKGSGAAVFLLLTAGIFLVFRKVIGKHSYLPVWQINRDYYRGYKENGDGWLYTLASIPFDLAFSWLNAQ